MEIKKYLKIFWIYKTCAHASVSDKYKAGKAGIYKGGDAHGKKQYKGNAGKRPLRMVNRLHGSPVAYMDRMETILASAGAGKGRCGSAHTGIQAGNTAISDNIYFKKLRR